MPIEQLKRSPSLFLIRLKGTKEYLYYNDTLLSKNYKFKEGKIGATTFTKQKKNRIITYFRREGFNVESKKA